MIRYYALVVIITFALMLLFWIAHISHEIADSDYELRQQYDDDEQKKALAEWSADQDAKKNN